ncbi:MAG TPA: hypothetical protein PKN23_02270 [Candidatus Hydrogenedentes bacterium]|nr:hypothetical protein [Candidatus Hydrogenedentota bacterium]
MSPSHRPAVLFPFLLAFAVCLAPLTAPADELAEKGRAVFESTKASVVTVKIVSSISFGGQDREREAEANAVVIAGDGLAVLSLSAVDPTAILAMMGEEMEGTTSKLVSLKMVYGDSSEHDAELVLRDKDLDLGFIRPLEKPAEALPFVNPETAAVPAVMDPVVVVGQLGPVAQRAHTAFVERIEGMVEKPRSFYFLGTHRSDSVLCSPVFTLDGALVGVGTLRMQKGGTTGGDSMVVVIPTAQVRELLDQVPPRAE